MAITRITNIASTIPDGSIANDKLSDIVNFKNIIINGDMSIAQRGTSTSSITNSGYYTVDRWRTGVSNAGTWTQTQSTDVPSAQGFFNSTKLDCTTADASLGAGDIVYYSHRFEGQNLQYLKKGTSSAESLTLSFWVKSNKTGTYICELYDVDNTRHIAKSYTISVADTWEKKTITYDGDTTGAFDNDNARSLDLNFWLSAGSNYLSGTLATSWGSTTDANRAVGQVNLADSTSNYINITGVQLEAGTSASDFEFLPVDINLQRCFRYFQKSYALSTTPGTANVQAGLQVQRGSSQNANSSGSTINLGTIMRSAPTVVSYDYDSANTTGQWDYNRSGAEGNASTSIVNQSEKSFSIILDVGASWVSTQIYGHYTADSEL